MNMKRRLSNWRPVGAVSCPRCEQNKSSGGYQSIETGSGFEKKLMCDDCRRTFLEWYEQRSDETGWVTR